VPHGNSATNADEGSNVIKHTSTRRVQKMGPNDFDFFIGNWRVHHRRLKERLAQNNDWEEFALW
jgi:hypothetical protein